MSWGLGKGSEPNSGKRWKRSEEMLVLNNLDLTDAELAEQLGRSIGAVRARRQMLLEGQMPHTRRGLNRGERDDRLGGW